MTDLEPLSKIVERIVTERYEKLGRNMTQLARSLGIAQRTARLWVNRGRWPYRHCDRSVREKRP